MIFSASAPPVESKKNASNNRELEDAKLKEACQEFEGVLLGQIFSQMRGGGVKSDLFGESKEEEMYTDMLYKEMANTMAKQDGTGLANLLYQQFKEREG